MLGETTTGCAVPDHAKVCGVRAKISASERGNPARGSRDVCVGGPPPPRTTPDEKISNHKVNILVVRRFFYFAKARKDFSPLKIRGD